MGSGTRRTRIAQRPNDHAPDLLEPSRLALIVVGAHLRAEVGDRPAAQRLQQRACAWLAERFGPERPGRAHPIRPVVCTDLWYLSTDALKRRPTISVGGPTVNALSAAWGDQLPSAFAIEGKLVVQMDVELHDLAACCWGIDAPATHAAVETFADKYLDPFLTEALKRRA